MGDPATASFIVSAIASGAQVGAQIDANQKAQSQTNLQSAIGGLGDISQGGVSGFPPNVTEFQRSSVSQQPPTTRTLQRRSQSNTFGAPDSQNILRQSLLRRFQLSGR